MDDAFGLDLIAMTTIPTALADTPSPNMRTIDHPGMRWHSIRWVAVNDNVMGGASEGGATLVATQPPEFGPEAGWLRFAGCVSLRNNGGFASIRLPVNGGAWMTERMTGANALSVSVRGDGKIYRLIAQTEFQQHAAGGLYQAAFLTQENSTGVAMPGMTERIVLPLTSFQASYRGRPLPAAPGLRAEDIRVIGFLIGDKQAGPFELRINTIELDCT